MKISFLNIPPETPEQIVTDFLESYADIEGKPMYVQKIQNGKRYCTGTRVYQITKLYQHIPRRLPNMFGRTIICIYDLQPEQQQYNETKRNQRQQNRTQYQHSPDNSDSSKQIQMKTQTIRGIRGITKKTQNQLKKKLQKPK